MELWIMWLIACGVLLVLEIFTVSFLLFFPGIAAFLAFIAAILGATIQVQAAIFVIASLVMIIFIRPVVAKIFKTKDVPMNSKN
ncbi:MAG: hypothetical protein RR201_03150, partial [Malacoplasma sp.]